jgi:DNA-binding NarL/FixJ family response regulator
VATARAVLGAQADDRDTVPIDMADAYLLARAPDGDSVRAADRLARRAAGTARDADLPTVACQAWYLRGCLAREGGSNAAVECFEAVDVIAKRHRMPLWTTAALAQLGHEDWLIRGGIGRLELAGHRADRLGARPMAHAVRTTIALQAVLAGRFAHADLLLDQCWREVTVLGLTEHARQILLVRAICAAHRGRRREMDRALAEFAQWGGEQAHLAPLASGLAGAFCALLHEDRPAAREHLARAVAMDADRPARFPLAGGHGLQLLLDVLDGDADLARYRAALDHPAGLLPWNQQFVLLAGAILVGRDGQRAEAAAMVARSQAVGRDYDLARHLGLRLVAEAAQAARWGDPVGWLRRAEDHFHAASIPQVASACRSLLRRTGVAVSRRRAEGLRVPHSLRLLGVTAREYEVLELLAERFGNQVIAGRLHISPRTVEKHVANLLSKIGQPNRWELSAYAAVVRDKVAP